MKVYLSHPIRGLKGSAATEEDFIANNAKAHAFARKVRDLFPEIDLYVPGEHDEFVSLAYRAGMLTVEQILDVDKMIIDSCQGVIYYNFEGTMSGGMVVEFDHNIDIGIPHIEIRSIVNTVYFCSAIEVLLEDMSNGR